MGKMATSSDGSGSLLPRHRPQPKPGPLTSLPKVSAAGQLWPWRCATTAAHSVSTGARLMVTVPPLLPAAPAAAACAGAALLLPRAAFLGAGLALLAPLLTPLLAPALPLLGGLAGCALAERLRAEAPAGGAAPPAVSARGRLLLLGAAAVSVAFSEAPGCLRLPIAAARSARALYGARRLLEPTLWGVEMCSDWVAGATMIQSAACPAFWPPPLAARRAGRLRLSSPLHRLRLPPSSALLG